MNSLGMQMLQMLQNGMNPQQLVMMYLSQQMKNNPIAVNLLTLAQQGKEQEIEQIARNIMRANGLDYDSEFSAFKKMIGR